MKIKMMVIKNKNEMNNQIQIYENIGKKIDTIIIKFQHYISCTIFGLISLIYKDGNKSDAVALILV